MLPKFFFFLKNEEFRGIFFFSLPCLVWTPINAKLRLFKDFKSFTQSILYLFLSRVSLIKLKKLNKLSIIFYFNRVKNCILLAFFNIMRF